MIDAWAHAAEAARAGAVLQAVAGAGDLIATLGRAARLRERGLGHPVPGAVSAAISIKESARSLG